MRRICSSLKGLSGNILTFLSVMKQCVEIFPLSFVEQKVLEAECLNLQYMFIITKACLGVFWPHFEKQDDCQRLLFDSLAGVLYVLRLFLIY